MIQDTYGRLPERLTDKRYTFETFVHTDTKVVAAGHVTVWADGLSAARQVLVGRIPRFADCAWVYTSDQAGNFGGIAPVAASRVKCPTCDGSGTVSAAASRSSDPDTSKAAGRRHETDPGRFSARSNKARLLRALVRYPMTAQEAAVAVLGAQSSTSAIEGCRRRVSDLKRAGFVIDSGERRCNDGSQEESIVWRASLAGVFALEALDETGWAK
jgi:hypothetical protein